MNHPADREQLLADVLADESSASFREALLTETLGLARRRRRFRQLRRAASGLVLVLGLSVLAWRNLSPLSITPEPATREHAIIRSQPLPLGSMVATSPLKDDQFVASARIIQIVQTAPGSAQLREIADAELLALMGSKPVALVRPEPHMAELVFVNPADRDELLRN